jgi:hypothetical protein
MSGTSVCKDMRIGAAVELKFARFSAGLLLLQEERGERGERAMEPRNNATIKHLIERARGDLEATATARDKDGNKERARASKRWREDNAKRNNQPLERARASKRC